MGRINHVFEDSMTSSFAPELRPLSMGQLLDRAIRIYRSNFWTFTGIVAITQIPIAILNIMLLVATANYESTGSNFSNSGNDFLDAFLFGLSTLPPWAISVSLAISFISFLLTMFAFAGIVHSVADVYLGLEVELVPALEKAWKRWLSLFWPLIVSGLFSIALTIFWMIIPILGWFTGLGMLLFWGVIGTYLITPIVLLERKGAFESLGRSWDLGRRRFWWLILFGIILAFFNWLIIQGPSLLIATLLAQLGGFGIASSESQIVQQVVNTLLGSIYLPLQLTCYTLMYFDIRIRTEGLDLSIVAESEEGGAPNVAKLLRSAPQTTTKLAPTGEEWLWFFLLNVGVYMLIAIVWALLFIGLFVAMSG